MFQYPESHWRLQSFFQKASFNLLKTSDSGRFNMSLSASLCFEFYVLYCLKSWTFSQTAGSQHKMNRASKPGFESRTLVDA